MSEPTLPQGWTSKYDSSFERLQYTHEASGKQTWLHPATTGPPPVTHPWETKVDDKGRSYYLNHDTKESSWKNPVVEAKLHEEAETEDDWLVGNRTSAGEEWWVNYKTGSLT